MNYLESPKNDMYNHVAKRIALAFCLGFGLLYVSQAAAQTPEQAQKPSADREHPAEAWMPAAAPVPPAPPGLFPSATSKPSANAAPKARPSVAGSNQKAKQAPQTHPAQMKLVAIYHGAGFFDAKLAEKLRPELAKAFGITPASSPKPGDGPADLLRSILGQNKSPESTTKQNHMTKTGQP